MTPVAAKTASTNVADAESGKLFNNTGAGAEVPFTLPTAVAGLTYTFVVSDADGIKVTAAAGDTIRLGTTVSKAAGYVSAAAIGSTLKITAINATEWIAEYWVGEWTVETA